MPSAIVPILTGVVLVGLMLLVMYRKMCEVYNPRNESDLSLASWSKQEELDEADLETPDYPRT